MLTVKKNEKKLIVLLALIFAVMLVFSLLTPMLADDYSYSFSYADGSRITSLSGIFASLANHRVTMNGRMVAHFFAMLFLLLPKPVFCLCNAALVTALFALLLSYAMPGLKDRENEWNRCLLLVFLIVSVWIFTPVYGQVFLWLDGACNYSWSCFFCLLFLKPFFDEYMGNATISAQPVWKKIVWCVIALLAGAYSEGGSFGFLGTAFLFGVCMLAEKRRLPKILIIGFFCACLGYLFLMTAPSEWSGRVGSFSVVQLAKNIKRVIVAPWESFPALFCIYAGLLALCFCFKVERKVIVASVVLFLGAWATVVLFAVAVYFPWRTLLPMVLLLCIACALMLAALCDRADKLLPVLSAVLCMVFVFEFLSGAGDIAYVFYQSRVRENTIYTAIENGESEVAISMYEADTKYSGPYLLPDVYEDGDQWPNYDLAQFYGIGRVVGVPVETDTDY